MDRYLTIAEAARQIASKQISPVELTQACLDRIKALDPTLHAFLLVTQERAMADARARRTPADFARPPPCPTPACAAAYAAVFAAADRRRAPGTQVRAAKRVHGATVADEGASATCLNDAPRDHPDQRGRV